MWREKNIYFTEHDIYFTKLMFILKNINLELKSALRTKYIFYRFLLYSSVSLFLFHEDRLHERELLQMPNALSSNKCMLKLNRIVT